MSDTTYPSGRPLVWLSGEVRSPPFTAEARREAGVLLRVLQLGGTLGLPASRPMPVIGPHCHELRVRDRDHDWRIVYHLAEDAVVILGVFPKRSRATPRSVIEACRRRLGRYQREEGDR